ncbi:hypothetical protein BKA61DRAFT_742747 [Leptodontidium sp. MPI-SDFR-AT-0119]|nr:hypothetical protein BKA61DRAFT_742747 [Leptodontidium sp. MPI-SDFR-AT-0119]
MSFKWINYTSNYENPRPAAERTSALVVAAASCSPKTSTSAQLTRLGYKQQTPDGVLGVLRVQSSRSIHRAFMSQEPTLDYIAACNPILHLPEYKMLFCKPCQNAIPSQELRRHLQVHHSQKKPIREPIVLEMQSLPVAQTLKELPPQPDNQPPLSFLPRPVPGHYCPRCVFYKATNFKNVRAHLNTEHKIFSDPSITATSTACFLQRWIQSPRGKWWKVKADAVPIKCHSIDGNGNFDVLECTTEANPTDEELAMMKMEVEEEQRLVDEEVGSAEQTLELEHDENTEWLRTSEWPRWFQNRPLHIIAAASATPSIQDLPLSLGSWAGEELVSPAVQEAVLRKLVGVTDHVLQRCEETLRSTPRSLRCWIKSSTTDVFPRPFEELQRESSRQKYHRTCRRFVCYVFRVHLVTRAYGLSLYEIFGLQLSRDQIRMMDFMYNTAAELDAQDATAFAMLAENMFQLLAMFWTDISKNGKMEACALVHFTGVLGIHSTELAYRTAYAFTPLLSSLIWIGRLLLLEYALPLQPYSYLKLPWPARAQYPDQVSRLVGQIHPKYMRKGCFSPLGYMCERMHHARTIANREGPRTNISWSADLQVLSIADQEISMPGLRQAAHLAVARTEQRARELMLGLWPDVDLTKIKDSLVTHRPTGIRVGCLGVGYDITQRLGPVHA